MKEKEFRKKYPYGVIEVGLYYGLDEEGNVVLDEEEMARELEFMLVEMNEFINKDELQLIVSEKLKQIKEKK